MSRATYIPDWRTCQFCRVMDDAAGLLKYGVRHYAHTRCYRDAKGFDALMALPAHVLDHSQPMTLPLDEAQRLVDAATVRS